MYFTKTFLASALFSVLLTAHSQALTISNADFEANGPGFVQADDWDGTNTARVADHASFRNQSALFGGGLHYAFTQGTTGDAEQTLSGMTYQAGLSYILGANVNYGSSDVGVDGLFELGYLSNPLDPLSYVTLGSDVIDLAPLNEAFAGPGNPQDGTGWAAAAAAPVPAGAGVGSEIIIRINSSATQGLWFDNVTLTTIPEPTTLALFGIGLLGIAVSRKRVA